MLDRCNIEAFAIFTFLVSLFSSRGVGFNAGLRWKKFYTGSLWARGPRMGEVVVRPSNRLYYN